MKEKLGTVFTVSDLLSCLRMYSSDCRITPINLEYIYENGHPAIIEFSFPDRPLTLSETKKEMIDPFLHKEEADEVLNEFSNICDENKIPFCLACGTCLGFYRDGGYIEGDNDIDILVNPIHLDRLIKVMLENKYKLGRRGGSQHFIKNHVLIDVWLKPVVNQPYAVVKYNNRLYPIPSDVERYLTFLYGDWKTPSKQSAKEAVHRSYFE